MATYTAEPRESNVEEDAPFTPILYNRVRRARFAEKNLPKGHPVVDAGWTALNESLKCRLNSLTERSVLSRMSRDSSVARLGHNRTDSSHHLRLSGADGGRRFYESVGSGAAPDGLERLDRDAGCRGACGWVSFRQPRRLREATSVKKAAWKSDDWGALDRFSASELARHARLVLEESSVPHFISAREGVLAGLHLKPGSILVELGAGPGPYADVTAGFLGSRGRWIVSDSTFGFVREGRRRLHGRAEPPTEFLCADARMVPIRSGSADAVLADKVLIHVSPIADVVAEMVRVVRPGGWVGSCDAEADAIFIHSSNLGLTRRVLRHCADRRPTPNAASLAAEVFAAAGLTSVTRHGYMCTMSDIEHPFVTSIVRHWAQRCVSEGAISAGEAEAWIDDVLGKAKTDSLLVTFCLVATWGQRPADSSKDEPQ